MKKILLTLLAVSSVSVAFAGTNSAILSVQGNLTGSCSISLSLAQLNFSFTNNTGTSPDGTQGQDFVSTLACSGGTLVTDYSINSGTGYNLVSATDATDTVPYTVAVTTISPPYTNTQLTQGTISMQDSMANLSLFTVATGNLGGLTIDSLGSPVVLGMSVTTALSLPSSYAAGSYANNLNFAVQY